MGECRFDENGYCCIHSDVEVDGQRWACRASLCTRAAAELEHALDQAHGVAQALERRVEEAEADQRFGTTIPCNRGTCCGCLIGKKIGKMLIFTCNECAQEAGRA